MIVINMPGWSLCVAAVSSLIYNGCFTHTHHYWHIYDLSCDGSKFTNCSLPLLSRKSCPVWRAPKSNLDMRGGNNFTAYC